MNRFYIFIIPLLILIITGCAGPPPPPPSRSAAQAGATAPESDALIIQSAEAPVENTEPQIIAPVEAETVETVEIVEQPRVAVTEEPVAGPAPAVEPAGQVIEAAAVSAPAVNTAECPAAHFLDVQAHPANSAYAAPALSVTCDGQTVTIRSNGIPNFEFTQVTPNDLAPQNYTWQIPLNPSPVAQPGDIPLLGPVAVAVNGVPIFGPNEAQPTWGDPYLDQILDYCNGHTAQQGTYHFHARPDCLFGNIEGNTSLVIGYALDGYPILAPYICLDAGCTQVKEVQSSWQRTQNVDAAWEAHEYVEGSGDLDRCNGLTLADGSYVYFATDTFPYFLGCYHGATSVNNGFGGPGGGGPGGGQGGPPSGNGQRQNGPPGDQNFTPPTGQRPDLAATASQLGISEQALREALGPPPPDLTAAAATLGVTEQALVEALGLPRR